MRTAVSSFSWPVPTVTANPALFVGFEEQKKGCLHIFRLATIDVLRPLVESSLIANAGVIIVYENGRQSRFYAMARSRFGEVLVLSTVEGLPEDCGSLHSAVGTAIDEIFEGAYFGLADDGLLNTDIEIVELQHAVYPWANPKGT